MPGFRINIHDGWKIQTMPGSFREESQFHAQLKGTCFYQSTLARWIRKELLVINNITKDPMGLQRERQMKITYPINKDK